MTQQLTVNYEGKPAYDILLEPDFHRLSEELVRLGMTNRKFMIVTDSNVANYYLEELTDLLLPMAKKSRMFCLSCRGTKQKPGYGKSMLRKAHSGRL